MSDRATDNIVSAIQEGLMPSSKPLRGSIRDWAIIRFASSYVVVGEFEGNFIRTSKIKTLLNDLMVETQEACYWLEGPTTDKFTFDSRPGATGGSAR